MSSMFRSFVTAVFILVTFFVAAPAAAQSEAGQQELSFLATYSDVPGGEGDGSLSLNARYSRFLTDAFSVGGGLVAAGALDDLDRFLFGEAFASYHFTPAEVNTFYVRAGYFTLLDEPGDGFLEGAGGYKTYLNEHAAAFAEAVLGHPLGDVSGTSGRLVVGLTYVF